VSSGQGRADRASDRTRPDSALGAIVPLRWVGRRGEVSAYVFTGPRPGVALVEERFGAPPEHVGAGTWALPRETRNTLECTLDVDSVFRLLDQPAEQSCELVSIADRLDRQGNPAPDHVGAALRTLIWRRRRRLKARRERAGTRGDCFGCRDLAGVR